MKFPQFFLIALFLTLTPLARGQTLEVMHSFNSTNGANPSAPLVQGSDGNFYGTTSKGGTNNYGTVFKITTNGILTTLVTFNFVNGRDPRAGLMQGNDGDFYGTTFTGGASGLGTVFKVTTNSTLTTLVSFNGTNGALPMAELIQATDGNFYGTTATGGATATPGNGNGAGNVFRMTSNGELTNLVSFDGQNGVFPMAKLVEGSDGNFYGTTAGDGNSYGTVFKVTTNGVLTTLVSFDSGNGRSPEAGLIQGSDGNFYGTTTEGGANNFYGTVFKMTPNGALTTLISFGETNGSLPHAGLIYGTDGVFYGTTGSGGPYGVVGATVFKMTSNGELSTIAAFNYSNGSALLSEVIQGRDGNLYGTTYSGGASNYGTVFRIVMPVSLDSRVSGHELVLSWPTNALGFTLQAAADLNSPTNWMDSTNLPAVVGAQFTVTNNLSGSAQFYRLKKP